MYTTSEVLHEQSKRTSAQALALYTKTLKKYLGDSAEAVATQQLFGYPQTIDGVDVRLESLYRGNKEYRVLYAYTLEKEVKIPFPSQRVMDLLAEAEREGNASCLATR